MNRLIPVEECGKPLDEGLMRIIEAVADAAVGEVARQIGQCNTIVEARGAGIAAGLSFVDRCGRRAGHEGECDRRPWRGVDVDCEECGRCVGFFLERGFRRCRGCGYPGQ